MTVEIEATIALKVECACGHLLHVTVDTKQEKLTVAPCVWCVNEARSQGRKDGEVAP